MAPDVTGLSWADDSRHLCGLAAAPSGQQLVVIAVDPARVRPDAVRSPST